MAIKQISLAITGIEFVTKRGRERVFLDETNLVRGATRLPDESTIQRFRHRLAANNLSLQIMAAITATLTKSDLSLETGTVVDATLITATSSTMNRSRERCPEMHQTKKGHQWHFGKAHIRVDAESGLVHSVIGTAANVHDVTQAGDMLHGEKNLVFGHAGYQGVEKPDQAEQLKASVRAKVEHPFRVLMCQFGFTRGRCKGLAKNKAQLVSLFALSNLWTVRKRITQGTFG